MFNRLKKLLKKLKPTIKLDINTVRYLSSQQFFF